LLPRTLCLLNTRSEGNRILPRYLGERDHPWLRALLDEHARFVGCRRSELRLRLAEPLPVAAPRNKLRLATRVLDRLTAARIEAAVSPQEARFALFRAAAASNEPRATLLDRVALELGIQAVALEAALFADLRGERRVAALPDDYSPSRFALEINAALVAGLLARAAYVRIRAWGNTRVLVRQARLSGLICLVTDEHTAVALDISGPFTLFRHTAVYRRALAALVPRLAGCNDFELVATCALGRGGRLWPVVVRSNDPIDVHPELERFDSRTEQCFAADFLRAAPDWDLIREPAPLAATDVLVFPAFELVHRRDPTRRWLLEIAGFWTPEYLGRKFEQLRAARIERVILCIDETRSCSDEPPPAHKQILYYRRRIDPAAVLAIIGG
jgi:uncharacterized protein